MDRGCPSSCWQGGVQDTERPWAYPDKKVLVFIDGMGPTLRGDTKGAPCDAPLCANARMKGYQVVVITAEGLQDETSLAGHFEELAMHVFPLAAQPPRCSQLRRWGIMSASCPTA
jgi:hypothetical protein